jgi:hypothetical protein
MNNQESKFKNWCIIELFGHQKIAGYCTEENIAGSNMLRVDVPETKAQPAFTKYYGSSAIYAINPVDETTALMAVENIQVAPINIWQGESFTNKFLASKADKSIPASLLDDDSISNPDFEDEDYGL